VSDSIELYKFRKTNRKQLKKITQLLNVLVQEVHDMSAELDALVTQVSETQTIEQSVIVLLQGIQTQLTALEAELAAQAIDTTTVTKLKDDLHASEEALASAVANFTPPPAPVP
jgi:HPt (histidine-containing phosphotransfer) domain-containing protein